MEAAHERFGRLDTLINNAGVMLLGPVEQADPEDWRTMVSVNVLGLLYCTSAALPIMRAQESGDIVNISSVAGALRPCRQRRLRAQDVANGILYAVSQPPHVSINEVLIRPTRQTR